MNLKATSRRTLGLLLCASLSACVSGIAHQNFKSAMQRQVGRSVDDPNVPMNRYPKDRGPARDLPNGNTEQLFRFGPSCQVYFEIEKASRKIVGWRYEGTQENCAIVP